MKPCSILGLLRAQALFLLLNCSGSGRKVRRNPYRASCHIVQQAMRHCCRHILLCYWVSSAVQVNDKSDLLPVLQV